MRRVWLRTGMLTAFLLVSPSVCAQAPMTQSTESIEVDEVTAGDDWGVVVYDFEDQQPGAMLELLETEMVADAALAEAGLGWIDGNEWRRELRPFAGSDASAMWAVLQPVLHDAPVAWTSAELRDTLEDPDPDIVVNN